MDALVYDIEIEKAIAGKGAPLVGIDYCEGWHDHEGMGISVICAYDYVTDRYRAFMKDNFEGFVSLLNAREIIVGFNNISFDNRVIEAHGLMTTVATEPRSYDILAEMWRAAGLDPTSFHWKSHGGYGLDETAKANLNHQKTGHGELAPVQWQRKEYGAVVDYCLADVWLTKALFDKVISDGSLISPKDGSTLQMKKPG